MEDNSVAAEQELVVQGETFRLRPYSRQDLPELVRTWRAAFGHELDQQIWDWKYHGPFGCHGVVCAHESGRIAAARSCGCFTMAPIAAAPYEACTR